MTIRSIHLARRFFGALNFLPLKRSQIEIVRPVLTESEFYLWSSMRIGDKRHSLEVLARFLALLPEATVTERRAALLHDVGKLQSDLGVVARVLATIVGPRGARFSAYHDHERLGAEMLRKIGSDEQTWRLVGGDVAGPTNPNSTPMKTMSALRRADES